jgi:hypothetical protein
MPEHKRWIEGRVEIKLVLCPDLTTSSPSKLYGMEVTFTYGPYGKHGRMPAWMWNQLPDW